MVKTNIIKQI